MNTVRVYYAGIPAKNTNKEKTLVLSNFHKGIVDDVSTEVFTPTWEESRLAVIQGWVHENSQTSPHLNFRKTIIKNQRKTGNHVLTIDSNLFLYADPGNTHSYLRFSLNGIFPTTGNYFTNNVDPARWEKIKKDLNINIMPWRTEGDHILICLQRNGGWSMDKTHVMDWCNKTIHEIKTYTDRKIVVRAHPGDKMVNTYLKINQPNVTISKNNSITDDLKNAWATVTYNSSPGVVSALNGIPVFVTDPSAKRSQAYDVANTDLSKILNPEIFDRQQWIEKISMSHFNFEDLLNGTAWKIIREYL
jgi:hypothetical protein